MTPRQFLTWAGLLLGLVGCEERPNKNHFVVLDKFTEGRTVKHTGGYVQLSQTAWDQVRVGDEVRIEGKRIYIEHPSVEVSE